jgi:hypothetical protein
LAQLFTQNASGVLSQDVTLTFVIGTDEDEPETVSATILAQATQSNNSIDDLIKTIEDAFVQANINIMVGN